jgi:hypothetical protein
MSPTPDPASNSDTATADPSRTPAVGLSTTHWLLILVTAVLVTLGASQWLLPRSASAQSQTLAGGRGVYAFTGQIDRDTYGLFMLDVDTETIWCYEMAEGRRGTRELKLIAGRSYEFDRYLKNYNTAAPSFRDVRDLLELERKTKRESARWTDTPDDTTSESSP